MKVLAYTKIQWIPSRIHLGANVGSIFWARIIKPKGARSLGFSWFSSFVDSQQIVPIPLKSFQKWCQHIICLNKLNRGRWVDTSNFFQDSGGRRDCGGDGSHWSRWQSGERRGGCRSHCKKRGEFTFYSWCSEELPFHTFFLQECFFFPKLRWIAILKDRVFQSSTFAKNSRRSSASQTGSRMENTMKSAGKVWSYTGLWMGWDDENGGGGGCSF